MPRWTARSRNLVRFARHLPHETLDESFAGSFGFRDAGSRFALLKSPGTAPGPDECFGLWARDDRLLFQKLLGLTVTYDGLGEAEQAALCTYNSMSYYRSHIVETFCHNGTTPMPPTEGECVLWFAAADVLAIRYRLVNKGAADVPVHLAFSSFGDPGAGCAAAATEAGFTFENRAAVIRTAYRARAEVRAADPDIAFAAADAEVASTPVARTLPAGGVLECSFAVRFAFNDDPFPAWPAPLWSDPSLAGRIDAAEAGYEALPPLDEAMARHRDLALKAAGTVQSLRYADRDPAGQPCLTLHVGKSGTAATWFWDTGCALPGLGLLGEGEAARGAIRLLVGGIQEDGTPPLTYEHQAYIYGYQVPLVTWGVGHYLAGTGDRELLGEVYEPLARYVRHWLERFQTPQGLVACPPGGTALDDALRWHTGFPLEPPPGADWAGEEWGRSAPDQFASPEINGFLYLELATLARLAAVLDRSAEASSWQEEACALAAAINAGLIEPETQTYQDRHLETGRFTGLVSLASFIPVYAGIAPAAVAEVHGRDYLLSPEHFLTPVPFPVIDRAHPTYRSGGFLFAPPGHPGSLVQHSYWRGRTWVHGDLWMLGALWQGGFPDEADRLCDQVLEALGRNEAIHECYDSLTGYGNGHPEFLWSAAAVLMLAARFYRQPPVAEFWKETP